MLRKDITCDKGHSVSSNSHSRKLQFGSRGIDASSSRADESISDDPVDWDGFSLINRSTKVG